MFGPRRNVGRSDGSATRWRSPSRSASRCLRAQPNGPRGAGLLGYRTQPGGAPTRGAATAGARRRRVARVQRRCTGAARSAAKGVCWKTPGAVATMRGSERLAGETALRLAGKSRTHRCRATRCPPPACHAPRHYRASAFPGARSGCGSRWASRCSGRGLAGRCRSTGRSAVVGPLWLSGSGLCCRRGVGSMPDRRHARAGRSPRV